MNSEVPQRISALGASATAGTPGFYSPRERPPDGQGNAESQYTWWMMRKRPDWQVFNRGMRGQRTDQMLARFDYDVLDIKARLVIILSGTNDLYQGYEAQWPLDHLEKMFARARKAGVQVLSASLLPLNFAGEELSRKIREFNEDLRVLAERNRVPFCDLYSVLEDPPGSGKIRNSPDGIHPGVDGYRRMGEALCAFIEAEKLLPDSHG